MAAHETRPGRTKPLLGAAALVVVLFIVLALLTGRQGYIACAPVAPASGFSAAEPATLDAKAPPLLEPPQADLQTPGAKARAMSAKARPPGIVTGRVIDAATTQAVPEVDVEIRCGKLVETARTSADGAFTTLNIFPTGRLSVTVTDDGIDVGRATRGETEERAGWTIEVPIGPTYPIAGIDGTQIRAQDWQARVVETALADGSAGEIGVTAQGLAAVAPSSETPDREWIWKGVREGSPPFVRFPKVMFPADVRYRVRLEVKSPWLYRKGDGKAQGTIGIQPAVIASTKAFAVVVGAIDTPANEEMSNARALLVDEIDSDASSFAAAPTWNEGEVQKGLFSFDEVTPGSKKLVIWAPGWRVASAAIGVMPGKSMAPTLRTSRFEGRMGDAEIDLGSGGMKFGGRETVQYLRLRLAAVQPLGPAWLRQLRRGGRLETGDLPSGEYSIENIALNMEPVLERRIEHETLPSERFGTPIHVAKDRALHRFELVDKGTGAPLAAAGVAFGPGGSMLSLNDGSAKQGFSLSRATAIVWSVWADDRAPRFGNQDVFQLNGDAFVARVELARGWGSQLSLRAGNPKESARQKEKRGARGDQAGGVIEALTAPPVPGVRISVDGQAAGASGPEGEVFLAGIARPGRIELHCDGWRLAGLERIPGPGVRYFVWMKRH